MWVNREINASDAFVAAWLPGSEGAGLADVLLRTPDGAINVDFVGRLPFSWPSTVMPVRLDDRDSAVAGAQFARGFGLDYTHATQLGALSEVGQATEDRHGKDVLYAGGHFTAPASLYVIDSAGQVRLTSASQRSPAGALKVSQTSSGVHALWTGDLGGEFQIGTRARDLSPLAAQGTALRLRLRVAHAPEGTVRLGVRCALPYGADLAARRGGPAVPQDRAQGCGIGPDALIDVTQELQAARAAQWTTLDLPLACLAQRGADLSQVSAPLALITAAKFEVTIADIRFVTADTAKSCPPVPPRQ